MNIYYNLRCDRFKEEILALKHYIQNREPRENQENHALKEEILAQIRKEHQEPSDNQEHHRLKTSRETKTNNMTDDRKQHWTKIAAEHQEPKNKRKPRTLNIKGDSRNNGRRCNMIDNDPERRWSKASGAEKRVKTKNIKRLKTSYETKTDDMADDCKCSGRRYSMDDQESKTENIKKLKES